MCTVERRLSVHFYPRPPGGGRLHKVSLSVRKVRQISIHALRVEGDFVVKQFAVSFKISIHALRVEGDCGNTDFIQHVRISIHALRVEGDDICAEIEELEREFLSTPSGWRATSGLP